MQTQSPDASHRQTGGHWQSGALVDKAAGFFTGAATIHGGPSGPTQLGDGEGLSDDERAIALAYGEHFNEITDRLAA